MEIEVLRAKIIEEVKNITKADVLEEILFILDKDNDSPYLDILQWKEKICSEHDDLFKRLS